MQIGKLEDFFDLARQKCITYLFLMQFHEKDTLIEEKRKRQDFDFERVFQ